MTQEEKQLLLKDLCARLPYNVVINCTEEDDEKTNFNCFLAPDMIKDIKSETAFWVVKPYLRPMPSMTEEEEIESLEFAWEDDYGRLASYNENIPKYIDWLNAYHFDYRGLIEKGLALEAPKGMY